MSIEVSAPKGPRQCRAFGLAAALACFLAACDPGIAPGTIGHVQGFAGVVASDEPQSVLVARDILSSGGSATDAAVAMYFTLSVTLPSRAGMAGYGACVVHQPKDKIRKWENKDEALVFIPQSPAALVVPRGLFAMHAKYGRLRWEALIGPAEGMARLGVPVSRALASDVAMAANELGAQPAVRKLFAKANGELVGEGDAVKNIGLASFMSRLRARGPADLYTGSLARELSDAAAEVGISLTLDEMRNVKAPFLDPASVKFGNLTAYFPPTEGGGETARLWKLLAGEKSASTSPSNESASGAGFMVADRDGQAVVCATSMGGLFGAMRQIPSLGMLLAGSNAPQSGLAPMMVVAHNVHEFRYALTSAGGEVGIAGLMQAAQTAILDEKPLIEGVRKAAGRRVVAIACPKGLPPHPDSCQVAVDPEAFGYGTGVGVRTKD